MTQEWPGTPVSPPAAVPGPAAPRQAPRRQAMPQIRFADDRDAMIRTVIGEAANQPDEGQTAVAAVINNRARQRGLPASQVVLERNQFEPWGTAASASSLMAIQPNDPRYIRASAAVDQALAGADPTGGADHFYAPRAQAALGRPAPSWAEGREPSIIGDHNFYNLGGSTEDFRQIGAPMEGEGQWPGTPVAPAVSGDGGGRQPDPIVGPRTQQPRGLVPASGYAANPALFDPSQPYNPARTVSPGETVSRALTDEEKANPELLRQQGYVLTGPGVWSYAPSPEQMVAMGYRPEGDAWVLNEGEDYIAARNDARSRMNAEDTGLPERIRAVTNGMSLGLGDELEQLLVEADTRGENLNRRIFGEEIPYTSQVAGTAYDDEADARQNRFRANRPMQNLGLELAGGLAAPGMQAGTRFINQGVGGVDRAARASLVGAGTGAVVGFGNAEGGLAERAPAAGKNALVGFVAGAAGQGALDRFSRPSTRAPSNARILSRAGVNMTPAQLLNGVPVAGRVARVLEQGAASIPFAGAVPAAAEREAVRSFNRAAINRVLGIIDEALPQGVSGREAIRAGDDIISARYRADLDPVVIQPNEQINERIMAALNPRNLSRTTRNTLQDTAADIVERLRGPITGPEWKQIDSELSGLINTTANGDAASRPLSRALRDVRAVVGDALEQAAPGTLARVRETDDAFGNFALIRKAASNPTTGRNDGLFSPDNLNSVLARSEGRAYGRGEARLQELVDAAVNVMAGTLPNSGTAERMATIGLATGAAGAGTLVNAGVAIPTIVGVSALYSQPAQRLMNAIYRASDSQTARGELAALAQLSGRTPALVPYYEAALERVLQLEATAGQGSPQARQSSPSQMSVQP